MEPVLDSIRNKYGSQLNVKFIDVIRNRIEAAPYKIRLMPTQLLFDTLNNEIYRHEGYFAEDSIHMFLQSKGLRLINH